MPVKPENLARYPADWKAISLAAKERAGWRCQHPGCKAAQYAVGHWELRYTSAAKAGVWTWMPNCGSGPHDAAGQGLDWPSLQRFSFAEARQFAAETWEAQGCEGHKPIVIVLTVAHLDHQPENCAEDNLRAWCQRHHLAYDAAHHKRTAYRTRKDAAMTLELF